MIFIAMPVMNEPDVEKALDSLLKQNISEEFSIFVCVNQPEFYWEDDTKSAICKQNAETLEMLNALRQKTNIPIHILDFSSPGKGWNRKKYGVGQARSVLLENINQFAKEDDLMACVDADSFYPETYLASLREQTTKHPLATGFSASYFHNLTDDEVLNRAVLHYEIYMRSYLYNLQKIGSPYAFTALGSAMAVPVWAYRKSGGMSPVKSGEDFYFLQKLQKIGEVICGTSTPVFPGVRYSDRVFFGTGPALIKGKEENWESYPVYNKRFFKEIEESFLQFPRLFHQDIEFPVLRFIEDVLQDKEWWRSLRKQAKTENQFVKFCHEKFDGLRTLQYLKHRQKTEVYDDDLSLQEILSEQNYPNPQISLKTSSIADLNDVRNWFFERGN